MVKDEEEEEEEEEEAVVVVGWWPVLMVLEALPSGCVIYCFLVNFSNEKELVMDGPTDRPEDRPTDRWTDTTLYRDARTHLKIRTIGLAGIKF